MLALIKCGKGWGWGDLGRSAMDTGIELVFCFHPMPIRQTIASQLIRMKGSLQGLKTLCFNKSLTLHEVISSGGGVQALSRGKERGRQHGQPHYARWLLSKGIKNRRWGPLGKPTTLVLG